MKSSPSRRQRLTLRRRLESLESRCLLATLAGHWVADDLTASVADGEPVVVWEDAVEGAAATALGHPRLVTDVWEGHAAVRFNRSDGVDSLLVDAADNPLAGADDFSVVVAFGTSSNNLNGGETVWFLNTGLVDATGLFGTTPDWGFVINGQGQLGAGLGQPPITLYSTDSNLNDGRLHVATYSRRGGELTLSRDGGPLSVLSGGGTAPREALPLTFGAVNRDNFAFSGDIVEIRLYDGALSQAEATSLERELVNRYSQVVPVAVVDEYQATEDSILEVTAATGVLANDVNVEASPLAAVLVDPPTGGQVALAEDGSFVYTPMPDFFGTDTFTYSANTAALQSVPAVVTIEVAPLLDVPQAIPDRFEVFGEFGLTLGRRDGILSNDLNPDRGPLVAELITDVQHGTLRLESDGSLTYRPASDFAGEDSFQYRAVAGDVASPPVTVGLKVKVAPSLTAPLVGRWAADDLNPTQSLGGRVSEWNDTVQGAPAIASGEPMLVRDVFNGRSAVYFDRGDGLDTLVVGEEDNPLAAAEDFTLAVVFSTAAENLNGGRTTWFLNTGIVDATDFFGTTADWGLAINAQGELAGGLGAPPTTVYSMEAGLNDGAPHVAIYTRSGGELTLSVDGGPVTTQAGGGTAPRGSFPITFGAISGGSLGFTGNIAEIRLYGNDLNEADRAALFSTLNDYYDHLPPTGRNDSYQIVEDGRLTVSASQGILANDVNLEIDPMTARLVDPPRRGVLTLADDGSFDYLPLNDFFGSDTFTYRASNPLDSEITTVTIEVAALPDLPQAVADSYLAIANTPLAITASHGIQANDLNPDRGPFDIEQLTDVRHGTLAVQNDGSFRYQPDAGFLGIDTFTYRAVSGGVPTDPVQVTLNVQPATLIISEVMAVNDSTLTTRTRATATDPFLSEADDPNDPTGGDTPDWLELTNLTDQIIDLSGVHLTDDANQPTRWTFPAGTQLEPHGSLVIFASGQDIRDAQLDQRGLFHTNFGLADDGEYLAVIAPDGQPLHVWAGYPQQVNDVSYGLADGSWSYFRQPTPGAPNMADVQPVVIQVTHTPNQPLPTEDLQVTARVVGRPADIARVVLEYQVMFDAPLVVPMARVGLEFEEESLVSIHTANIPRSLFEAGELVRWSVTVESDPSHEFRLPRYLDREGTKQSPQFFGTVVLDPRTEAPTPALQWFAEDLQQAESRTGSRASLFYNGEYYDNIFVRNRGGATNGQSQKFTFNKQHRFLVNEKLGRVREINVNAQGSDSAYIRQSLAFQTYQLAGHESSESFLIPVWKNGASDRVGIFIEQVDEDFLSRNGLDPLGTLYKMVQRGNLDPVFNDTVTGIEKKTRLDLEIEGQPAFEDLQNFVDGLHLPTQEERRNFLIDNLDVPQVLNYLALRSVTLDADDVRKNFYFYRDTRGSGEWSIFPWDKDWTFGVTGDGGPSLSHPFFGDEAHRKPNANQWNVLYDVLFADPILSQMFLRRLRSVMDQLLLPPDTPETEEVLEPLAREILQPVGELLGTGVANTVENLIRSFFDGRRQQLYVNHSVDNPEFPDNAGIPRAQPADPPIAFGRILAGGQGIHPSEDYLELVNPLAVPIDVSGWQLSGTVAFTFHAGTVIPASGSLFVSPDVVAFRARSASPRGGEGLFVEGPYIGQLSDSGGDLRLRTADGAIVAEGTYAGHLPSAASGLRISEIHYHPAAATSAEALLGHQRDNDFEFIELVNVADATIDLQGARLTATSLGQGTQGVAFDLGQGTITSLAPGERLVVVEDVAAFVTRYGNALPIAGGWTGGLSNNREQLTLTLHGEPLQQFSYDDDWHPVTDGAGPTLEIVDAEAADLAVWGTAAAWRPSAVPQGTPGRSPLPGDFNGDRALDSLDIDVLSAHLRSGGSGLDFDLNQDGEVGPGDVDHLLTVLLGSSLGDANLDGDVDSVTPDGTGDGEVLLSHLGSGPGARWADGDFDGDGQVTASGDGALLLAQLTPNGDNAAAKLDAPPLRRRSSTWK